MNNLRGNVLNFICLIRKNFNIINSQEKNFIRKRYSTPRYGICQGRYDRNFSQLLEQRLTDRILELQYWISLETPLGTLLVTLSVAFSSKEKVF